MNRKENIIANSPFYRDTYDDSSIPHNKQPHDKLSHDKFETENSRNSFIVMSYNIWFDEKDRNIRTDALVCTIRKHCPDVVCLQEVIPEIYEKLKNLLHEYKYYFPNNLKNRYGCVIFSKYMITQYYDDYYPNTKMGRNLLAINIKYNLLSKNISTNSNNSNNSKNDIYDKLEVTPIDITIATSHFESLFDNSNMNVEKIEQYIYANNILNKLYDEGNPVILCSDTNLLPQEEKYFFPDRWVDVFTEDGENPLKKFTYDTRENKNLLMRNIKEIRSRIDRIVYRGGLTLKADGFRMIKGPIKCSNNCEVEPSDHFGIIARFNVSDSEIEI
ncbi:MAG: endonuclease/exonuclease/phosphatase family protein [Terrestrivirus sp.]|uniref:Endonuclease/exonuclease/phosphatase family protein n=1 Tax=Terrestrivirus sp. TaxID=2487775 RepID=A0A3G4ZM95_9VIRU|nr:MAG: endonuclease/exonuclease/phosphatase family protein [Terrestrivirus sp.]